VQDEVARKVVSELAVALTTPETERLARKHTKNFEAYDMYLMQGKQDDAVAAAEKAATLAPGDAMTIKWLGHYLHWAGRGEEAVATIKKSMELDPMGSRQDQGYLDFLGWACFTAGLYEESISNMKKAREEFGSIKTRDPFLIASYSMLGRMDEAQEAARQWLKIDPTFSLSSWPHARLYKRAEDSERLLGASRKAGLK
jgi:tetratricopeptide (TPR) repeat protein